MEVAGRGPEEKMTSRTVKVQCYAGYKADERPLSFTMNETTLAVAELVDRWYDIGANYFKVVADDGHAYLLRHDLDQDRWELVLPKDEE